MEEKAAAPGPAGLTKNPPSPTHPPPPPLQGDLRRAVEEKVAALDLLASAERRLVEQQGDSGAIILYTYI